MLVRAFCWIEKGMMELQALPLYTVSWQAQTSYPWTGHLVLCYTICLFYHSCIYFIFIYLLFYYQHLLYMLISIHLLLIAYNLYSLNSIVPQIFRREDNKISFHYTISLELEDISTHHYFKLARLLSNPHITARILEPEDLNISVSGREHCQPQR